MTTPTKLACLFLAGGSGCLARYALGTLAHRLYGGDFPIGTIVVNLVGCLLFGFVWTLADSRLIISVETRFLILTGFMGAFTTFSTFAFENEAFLRESQWLLAIGHLLGHNILGIGAIAIGIALGRLL